MSSKNLVIELKAKQDRNGKTFYVGKLKGPFLIDCEKGATFLVYTSEINCEELQIAPMDDSKED